MLTPRIPAPAIRGLLVVGLTGGIGSGKSEAARVFAEQGIPVLEADKLGHEVIAPGGTAYDAVVAAFGPGILRDGAVDRARLAALVFADTTALDRLNAIAHPAISQEIAKRCQAFREAGQKIVLIDAALLAEKGERDPFLDLLIVVHSNEAERVRRLVEHRGMSELDARKRIASQTPPEHKLAIADWVIENNDGLEELRARALEVIGKVRFYGDSIEKMPEMREAPRQQGEDPPL